MGRAEAGVQRKKRDFHGNEIGGRYVFLLIRRIQLCLPPRHPANTFAFRKSSRPSQGRMEEKHERHG